MKNACCRHWTTGIVAVGSLTLPFSTAAHARTISFSGYSWDVKAGSGLGPGPNDWSDSEQSVWVDGAGDLHLKVRKVGQTWYSAQVTNQTVMGYGRYEFRVQTNPGPFDPNVVVGLFTYENDFEEIDIEFARWGDPQSTYAQYATQPSYVSGNKHTFDMQLSGNYSTHIFEWTPDAIVFTSIHGHHSSSPPGSLIETWTYTGGDIPTPSGEQVRMNLWLFQGNAPSNGQSHEFIIDSFTYTPDPNGTGLPQVPEPAAASLLGGLSLLALTRRRR